MRAKDAVDNERKVALRNVERQVKVIERYSEAEKTFAAQLVSARTAVHPRLMVPC